ncbi:hypothetical protein M5K25_007865 [Dendrobium thyrsiflorum]|uniref:Uncharacterized protein n=1 Tax=Dendrobium thyrsiflorum TaxID=117978 RepID=A0ABD0V793_DENTH
MRISTQYKEIEASGNGNTISADDSSFGSVSTDLVTFELAMALLGNDDAAAGNTAAKVGSSSSAQSSNPIKLISEYNSGPMSSKKVDALEEKLEGKVGQFKSEVEKMISSMEGRFSNLEDMMNKILELHTQPEISQARALVGGQGSGGNPDIDTMRDDREVEILGDRENMPPLEMITRREMSKRYNMRNLEEETRKADFEEDDIYEKRRAVFGFLVAAKNCGRDDSPLEQGPKSIRSPFAISACSAETERKADVRRRGGLCGGSGGGFRRPILGRKIEEGLRKLKFNGRYNLTVREPTLPVAPATNTTLLVPLSFLKLQQGHLLHRIEDNKKFYADSLLLYRCSTVVKTASLLLLQLLAGLIYMPLLVVHAYAIVVTNCGLAIARSLLWSSWGLF